MSHRLWWGLGWKLGVVAFGIYLFAGGGRDEAQPGSVREKLWALFFIPILGPLLLLVLLFFVAAFWWSVGPLLTLLVAFLCWAVGWGWRWFVERVQHGK
jgi:hypothetical protein